jgi:LmbE family N-acetylglucosaminyl deacetylase
VGVAVIAAHPDDEALGLGTLLPGFGSGDAIVHITDGAPRRGPDVRNAGCATWQQYAALRRRELEAALTYSGVSATAAIPLGCPDQETIFRLAEQARRLADTLDTLCPSLIFTHAYEGGHPDHDAAAAAVHAAVRLLRAKCRILEFAGYHAGSCGFACESFVGSPERVIKRPLRPDQKIWKRKLLSCYASQAGVLANFPLECEPLRPAPTYDFGAAPHSGPLLYDGFDWGVRSNDWRMLARRAFGDLGISCEC